MIGQRDALAAGPLVDEERCLGGLAVTADVEGVDDVGDNEALRGGLDAQVDESGSRDIGGGNALGVGERGGQPAGQLPGVDTDLLRQLGRGSGGKRVCGIAEPTRGSSSPIGHYHHYRHLGPPRLHLA